MLLLILVTILNSGKTKPKSEYTCVTAPGMPATICGVPSSAWATCTTLYVTGAKIARQIKISINQ